MGFFDSKILSNFIKPSISSSSRLHGRMSLGICCKSSTELRLITEFISKYFMQKVNTPRGSSLLWKAMNSFSYVIISSSLLLHTLKINSKHRCQMTTRIITFRKCTKHNNNNIICVCSIGYGFSFYFIVFLKLPRDKNFK